ncbi:hypothetical protein Tco_1177783 [Tanacetum coccineum]
MEYLVNISKRRAFWSLNEDILKINDSDYQYAVSIKEDTAYPCLHSPKTTKETSSIRRIQRRPIRRIEDIVCEDSGRYQAWSLLQETPNTPYCMTRSSTNELFTPYEEPEQEFRSSRRHFKTLSLDELRSPDFKLFSDQEYSEEEEAETMAETMEQYMSKTRIYYGSGVARPKIVSKDQFELKGQFRKELRENTFIGSDHEDANEHIEKVLEIVDLFHIPNITILDSRGAIPSKTVADAKTAIQEMAAYSQKWHNGTSRTRSTETSDGLAAIQVQLNNLGREIKNVNKKVYAAQVGCEQCKGPHYTKDFPLKEERKTLEEAYYMQFGRPFQGGGIEQQLWDSIKGAHILRTKNEGNQWKIP